MATIDLTNSKTIDELQELGKLTGSEKTIVSDGQDTRKVTIDTIVGYAAAILNGATPALLSLGSSSGASAVSKSIVFIPEEEEIPINERTPGCFYLEETHQTSIRTQINIPTSVRVSGNLGLKRV